MDIDEAVKACKQAADKIKANRERGKRLRDSKRAKKLDSARRDKAASTRIRK